MTRKHISLLVCACVLGITSFCSADKLKLKNGTVIEGTVINNGDSYWVKPSNGDPSKTIPADQVDSVEHIADAPPDSTARPAGPVGKVSAQFGPTKHQADQCDLPDEAVSIWEKYIAASADPVDTAAADAELDRWKKLQADDAERINGKWVRGDERKAIVAKATALSEEAWQLIHDHQTLAAMKKLEEAAKIYPNNFDVNFAISWLDLYGHNEDEAIKFLEICKKQRPNSAAILNNYAVALIGKKQFDKAVLMFEHAAELEDSQAIAQNLVSAIALLNDRQRAAEQFKAAVEAANLLASKYHVGGPMEDYLLMHGDHSGDKGGAGNPAGEEGAFASGTGFLLTADGLILTNHHVIADAKRLTVTLSDGSKVSAEVVVIDDVQDLALIRIKAPAPLPFVQFARDDHPGDGADCVALGYPLIDRLGSAIKITKGIVSSGNNGQANGADILTDTKVNPGNSGGPLVNSHGGVMGIVTLKSIATSTEDSYGMAISAGHIRKFLEKNNVTTALADESGPALIPQDIAKKIEPATVCIIASH